MSDVPCLRKKPRTETRAYVHDVIQRAWASKTEYACLLTQHHLADALGLTAIHVNRVLRQLREAGMVTFRDGIVTFDNYSKLVEFAEFDPTYLNHGGPRLR